MLMFDNKHKNPTWGYILANMHKGAYAEIPYSKTMNQKKILALDGLQVRGDEQAALGQGCDKDKG